MLPRLLYGLEALIINKTELVNLERAYKRLLKTLLGLREGTADEAAYMLFGLLPAEAELHLRILSLYGGITRLENNHPLLQLALRQAACPTEKRKGWFGMVFTVARKYLIEPAVMAAISSPWQKNHWKSFTRNAVHRHWVQKMREEAARKSSMKYMASQSNNPHAAHHLWPRGGCASRKRVAASFRAKMISGSYILQANRARFNQNTVNPTCPLCGLAPEDLPHFMLSCPSLDPQRSKLLPKIKRIASDLGMHLSPDHEGLCRDLLNTADPDSCCACSGRSVKNRTSSCRCSRLNDSINQLCLDLHNARTQVLSQIGKGL